MDLIDLGLFAALALALAGLGSAVGALLRRRQPAPPALAHPAIVAYLQACERAAAADYRDDSYRALTEACTTAWFEIPVELRGELREELTDASRDAFRRGAARRAAW